MTTINTSNKCVTLVNVFTVLPQKQDELADILVEATKEVIRFKKGFISANIHKSPDGTRVTNYAQWRTKEDFEAMTRTNDAIPHMKKALEISTMDGHQYNVFFTDEKDVP
jgi:heme-degrading monooxygenase HmoA